MAFARAIPVLFSCPGCPEHGQVAREVGRMLDRSGLVQAHWLGGTEAQADRLAATARSRFPVLALDGCSRHCAQAWLAGHGVRAQRHFALAGDANAAKHAAQIAERLP